MIRFTRGQKGRLGDLAPATELSVSLSLDAPGLALDVSCFGVDTQGKLSDDRYFAFFNQVRSPNGEIVFDPARGTFDLALDRLPTSIDRLVFTAAVDGAGALSGLRAGTLSLGARGAPPVLEFPFTGADFQAERAIIVAEIYRKDVWRFAAVGQGFVGGLQALLEHFGGEALDEPAAAPPPPPPPPPAVSPQRLSLDKKMAEKAPELLSLAKKAELSLQKKGLTHHRARVALVLDISASMTQLYNQGKVQTLAERVLALATRFDDDGAIDVFLFGQNVHEVGEMSIDNFKGFVAQQLKRYRLEGATYYGKAIHAVRSHYFPRNGARELRAPVAEQVPVYVMFLTDGATGDERFTEQHITWSSFEPIFWQFMGIGKSKKDARARGGGFFSSALAADFTFLEKLDELKGRHMDNADFFSVEDPAQIADEALYELLMAEYPEWVRNAPAKGLLR